MNEALKNEIQNMKDLRTQEWIMARLSNPDSQGNMAFSPDMDDFIKRLVILTSIPYSVYIRVQFQVQVMSEI